MPVTFCLFVFIIIIIIIIVIIIGSLQAAAYMWHGVSF